mgnify:FL=1
MAKQILRHQRMPRSVLATTLALNMAVLPMTLSAEEVSEEIIEEVVVTGSRIATTNETSSQPLLSISSDALTSSGQLDISEVLNDTPSLTASISATNSLDATASNVGGTNNFGGAALDLRGLGFKRTLTLVNGRRHVAGIEGTASVDITTIPAALVERVDVLSGGASAVYGSDALTGVVNFVLKEDFEGLEFSVQTGTDQYMDNSKNRLSLVGGRNFADGRGNITFALQMDQDNGLLMGDRSFLANENIYDDGNNPALRFQKGDISAGGTPSLSQYYNFDNTGLFPWGLRIPSQETFVDNYTSEFGSAPTLNAAEAALFAQAAAAPPRALLPGYTFNITSPYGVVALGDFPLAGTPDLDGNGTADCLDSFTGYNSSLDGAGSFGAAGGCWVIAEDGSLGPYSDGLVAGSFNQFGASQSYIRPNDVHAIPETEAKSIDVIGHYDFTDTATLFFEAKYNLQEITSIEQYHNFTDLLHGLPDNPYLPESLAALADNGGAGFAGMDGGLQISRDSMDWGDNINTSTKETLRIVYGVRGDLTDTITYEASLNYGQYSREAIDREEMIADRFFAAIDAVTDPATGEAVCRSSLDPTAYPKTTPFNIFQFTGGGTLGSFFTFTPGDGQCQPMNIWGGAGAMSQASIDFVTFDREIEEEIKQIVYSGFITGDTSTMFELPGGAIEFAVGIEYRDEITSQTFGALDQGILPVSGTTSDGTAFLAGGWVGDVSNAQSLGPQPSTRLLSSNSSYDFLDYFLELKLPVIADVPGIYELNVDLAYRSSDNSIFGDNDTYTYGLVYSPIADIRLRYTFSEATRVPNLFELFSPEQGARFRPDDPCASNNISSAADPTLRQANCVTDLQANGVDAASIFDDSGNYVFEDPLSAGFPGAVGGNENLQPETGETTSYGVIFAPSFIEGLVLSVDYIEIDIADAIVPVSAQNIVNRCYDSPTLSNSFCPLISRNDDSASAQSGGLDYLRQVQLNFGAAIYEGYDYTALYDFSLGDFDVSTSVSWTTVEALDLIEQGGEVDTELGEMRRPEDSAIASVSLSRGEYSVGWTTQYLSKQTLHYEGGVEIETAVDNYGSDIFTDSTTLIHSLRASYVTDGLSVFGGVNNVTDEEPYKSERAYPVSPIGRYFYVGATFAL